MSAIQSLLDENAPREEPIEEVRLGHTGSKE
jgi:hypothetical protein